MRILVTGGAGFIGSNLVAKLLSSNHEVHVLDDLSTGSKANLKDMDVNFIQGSILDTSILKGMIKEVDEVVHLAAIGSVPRSIVDPDQTFQVNVIGTFNLLELGREFGKGIIFASSSSVYGDSPEMPRNEKSMVMPKSPYAASKLSAESFVNAFGNSYAMKNSAFRFFNVYGPNQAHDHPYAAVIPRFISAALKNKPIVIEGDGLQVRDFTYVDDVVRIITMALESNFECAEPINIGAGKKTSLLELISLLERHIDVPLELKFVESRVGDVRESYAKNDILKQKFEGVEFTPLSTGLIETIKWYRETLGFLG